MALDPSIQAAIVGGISAVCGALVWAIRAIANRHLASLDKVTSGQEIILQRILEVDSRAAERTTAAVKQISDMFTAQLNVDRRLAAIEAAARTVERSPEPEPDPNDTLPSSGNPRPSGRRRSRPG